MTQTSYLDSTLQLLRRLPKNERLALAQDLTALMPGFVDLLFFQARSALESGNRALVMRTLSQVERLDPDLAWGKELADFYSAMGEDERALTIFENVLRKGSSDVGL